MNINNILFVVLTLGEDFFHRLPMTKRWTFQQFCGQMKTNSVIQTKWATALQRLTSSSVIDGNNSPNAKLCAKRFFHFGPHKKINTILSYDR